MTTVVFHVNVPDKLHYACRLLRKASGQNTQVWVHAEEPTLTQLDQLLWTFTQQDFVPHCRIQASETVRAATLIWLGDAMPEALPNDCVLLNLSETIPINFERFARCIEVVSTADTDRATARLRWKQYSDQGIDLTHHNAQA